MEVSGHLHVPATLLLGSEHLVLRELEATSVQEVVWWPEEE